MEEKDRDHFIRMIVELQAAVLELRENSDMHVMALINYRSALIGIVEHLLTNFHPLFKDCEQLKRAARVLDQEKTLRM